MIFAGTEGRMENIGDMSSDTLIRVWNKRNTGCNPEGNEDHPIPAVSGSHGGADPAIVKEFIAFLRREKEVRDLPIAARNAVAAASMGTESVRRNGEAMDIPPLSEDVEAYFLNDGSQLTPAAR